MRGELLKQAGRIVEEYEAVIAGSSLENIGLAAQSCSEAEYREKLTATLEIQRETQKNAEAGLAAIIAELKRVVSQWT